MTRSRTLLFAVASGASVGSLYTAQPLLEEIAGSLGIRASLAALLVTVTQIGYVVGIFLLVPLGDLLDRRRLIPAVLTGSGLALACAAAAPGWRFLFAALLLVGLTAVSAQLLVPLASQLASPGERGRVIGTVASGSIIGILVCRTASGAVADQFGWRAFYLCAAGVAWVLAVVLSRAVPALPAPTAIAYRSLLRSVFTTFASSRAVQATSVLSAAAFGTFTLFWTALTFLLSAPPFSYSLTSIGLVGLVGLIGALVVRGAGRLHDEGRSVPATGLAIGLGIVSLVVALAGGRSIVVLLIAIIAFDIATQAVLILNQTRLLSIDPAKRGRLNTISVVSNFVGGAVGSALAGVLWNLGGWLYVSVGGIAALVLALLVWLVHRRTLGATPSDRH